MQQVIGLTQIDATTFQGIGNPALTTGNVFLFAGKGYVVTAVNQVGASWNLVVRPATPTDLFSTLKISGRLPMGDMTLARGVAAQRAKFAGASEKTTAAALPACLSAQVAQYTKTDPSNPNQERTYSGTKTSLDDCEVAAGIKLNGDVGFYGYVDLDIDQQAGRYIIQPSFVANANLTGTLGATNEPIDKSVRILTLTYPVGTTPVVVTIPIEVGFKFDVPNGMTVQLSWEQELANARVGLEHLDIGMLPPSLDIGFAMQGFKVNQTNKFDVSVGGAFMKGDAELPYLMTAVGIGLFGSDESSGLIQFQVRAANKLSYNLPALQLAGDKCYTLEDKITVTGSLQLEGSLKYLADKINKFTDPLPIDPYESEDLIARFKPNDSNFGRWCPGTTTTTTTTTSTAATTSSTAATTTSTAATTTTTLLPPLTTSTTSTSTTTTTTTTTTLPAGYVVQGGLTWMPVTFYDTWNNASAYCASFNGRGQSGWRMPTQAELSALSASGVMSGQGWTLYFTWSSTPYAAGYHYRVTLTGGSVGWSSDANGNYVSCVR